MSKYRYITIGARIAPLDTILTRDYAEGVQSEICLAEAAPELLAALRPVAELYEYEQTRGLFPRGQTWDTIPHNIGQAARAAIARAEGSK